ncbi:MAG TPA: excinuclease ABC subunit UvrA [Candidatus Binatia bacterium]|nr:excinuclease ABC subunit UvrA [Candidatus Binatia bacterium]
MRRASAASSLRNPPNAGVSLKPPIRIAGARTHNLRDVTCDVPQQALTVVTGVSGSGKSSLVFDTLYAEGQRRFVQSMSTYTRLFLERMERPDVDFVSNIPPAIALAQKNAIRNARSTVGTITEINDYLRLLYTHVGETSCLACGGRVLRDDPETGIAELRLLAEGAPVLVLAPLALRGLPIEDVVAGLLKHGHRRACVAGEVVRLDELEPGALASAVEDDCLLVVIDRLVVGKTARARMREALERAFGLGEGRARLLLHEAGDRPATRTIRLDRRFTCRDCGREALEPSPNLFSFNSPLGACPECEGFGRVTGVDQEKVIPDPRKSLADGAIVPWQTPSNLEMQEWMMRVAARHDVRTHVAYARLTAAEKQFVLEGEPRDASVKRRRREWRFPGVLGFFKWLERKRYKTHVRILLARYRGYTPCAACGGQRLRPDALAVRIAGKTIAEITALPVSELARWTSELRLDDSRQARAARLLADVRSRLAYLIDVGLDYLTLARQARTLSGGEAQRIHLASALGSALTDTLYCLDEPTVGLHARDSQRLLNVLHKLTAAGNTVVLVEHDPVVIEGADHVIDLGPGGGARGGRVLYAGAPAGLPPELSETGARLRARTLDGASLAADGASTGAVYRAAGARGSHALRGGAARGFTIHGARENNLKNVTVTIPYGQLTCVTGVSGSGKSTLVEQVLYCNWRREQGEGADAGVVDRITGLGAFDDVVLMTQAPVGRSARSNAVTYLKAYDEIRKLLAATPAARLARIGPRHFSFNTAGGRCETCSGMGTVTIEMHFMADLTVACDACGGARFKPNVLAVRYRGRNVNEILSLTIDEAVDFFGDAPRIRARLAALRAVGLGYLTLGQPTSTLSGGEAQRLKLASFVDAADSGERRLLVFDEPTTGLHLSDVARLIDVLRGLVERGQTVLVVEHNLDFIAAADHVVDLGPEGGERGGEVVAEGSPLELARRGGTPTADALRGLLSGDGSPPVREVSSELRDGPHAARARRDARGARRPRRTERDLTTLRSPA